MLGTGRRRDGETGRKSEGEKKRRALGAELRRNEWEKRVFLCYGYGG
ncbi:MAG: hypothetical protein GYA41_03805 [Bacteroidales bacterium]|nr:hypothetical protein [Bacteroidales bacterium]